MYLQRRISRRWKDLPAHQPLCWQQWRLPRELYNLCLQTSRRGRAITAKVSKMARGEVLHMNWWMCWSNLLPSPQILQRETRQLFCRITHRVKDGECSSMISVLPSLRQLVFASLGRVGELLHQSVWRSPATAGSTSVTWLPPVKLTLRALRGKPAWKPQIKKLILQLEWKPGLDELNFEEIEGDLRSTGQSRLLRRTCL